MDNNKNSSQKFLKGAALLTFSVIIVKAIGFIYKVPLSYILGDEGMGYFNSAYTIFGFFYLLCTGGVPRAVSIMVTSARSSGNDEYVKKTVKYAFIVFASLGMLFSTALLLLAHVLSNIIGSSLAMWSLISIAPSLFFVSAGGVLRGYLNGEERFLPIAISQLAEGVIKFIFGLFFALFAARAGYGVEIISAFTIIGVTLGSFAGTVILSIPSLKVLLAPSGDDCDIKGSSIILQILKIATPLTLSSAIMGISSMVDLGLIMHRLTSIGYSESFATALYGNYTTLVVPMLNLISALIAPLSAAALPMITTLWVRGDRALLSEKSREFLGLTAFFAVPVSIGFMFFSEEILLLLFNDASAKIASPLLTILAPSIAFIGILTMSNTFLEAASNTSATLIAMSVGAVVKIISSYFLIGNPEIAIYGAPLSTTISYAVSLLVSAAFLAKKTSLCGNMILPILKPCIYASAAVLSAKLVYNLLAPLNFSVLFLLISIALSIVIYMIFWFFDSLLSADKCHIMSNVTKNAGKN